MLILPTTSLMWLGVSVVVDFGGVVGGEEATTKMSINSPQSSATKFNSSQRDKIFFRVAKLK